MALLYILSLVFLLSFCLISTVLWSHFQPTMNIVTVGGVLLMMPKEGLSHWKVFPRLLLEKMIVQLIGEPWTTVYGDYFWNHPIQTILYFIRLLLRFYFHLKGGIKTARGREFSTCAGLKLGARLLEFHIGEGFSTWAIRHCFPKPLTGSCVGSVAAGTWADMRDAVTAGWGLAPFRLLWKKSFLSIKWIFFCLLEQLF